MGVDCVVPGGRRKRGRLVHPAIWTVLAIHAAGLAALAISSGLQSYRWAREDREQAREQAGDTGDAGVEN